MKNWSMWCLLIICCACIAFTLGFFIGRNANHSDVQVSALPTQGNPPQQPTSSDASGSTQPQIVNINTATAEELQTLPGIGPTLAQQIIAYRELNGPFDSTAELADVEGIGLKRLESIIDLITTGG